MRAVFVAMTIAIIALLGTSQVNAQSRAHPAARTWEYREVKLDSSQSSLTVMNTLGSEGWDLANVVSDGIAVQMKRDCEWWAYFNRPKS